MNVNTSQAILEKMRNAIRIMRKNKSDNRFCGGVRLFVGEDVLSDLLAGAGSSAILTGSIPGTDIGFL